MHEALHVLGGIAAIAIASFGIVGICYLIRRFYTLCQLRKSMIDGGLMETCDGYDSYGENAISVRKIREPLEDQLRDLRLQVNDLKSQLNFVDDEVYTLTSKGKKAARTR